MYVIFTDIDNTIIDDTYSASKVRKEIEIVKRKGIPLVFMSSKTRYEVEYYRQELGIEDPFSTENGSFIFIPEDYFTFKFPFDYRLNRYLVLKMGEDYRKLRKTFLEMRKNRNVNAIGFGDLSINEISEITGLPRKLAKLSKQREGDEPFITEDKGFVDMLKKMGFNVVKGGRFYHLMGNTDKGKAFKRIFELYKREYPDVISVAFGDADNDLQMLQSADISYLVTSPEEWKKRIRMLLKENIDVSQDL